MQITEQKNSPKYRKYLIIAAIALGISGVAIALWSFRTSSNVTETTSQPEVTTITGLGRLAPKGEVIKLSASTSSQEQRVGKLLVKEGDRIKANQVIAILDARDRLEAALAEAEEQVNVSRSKLAVIQAGAKSGEIIAQQAEVDRIQSEGEGTVKAQTATLARLESERQNAQIEYNRYQALFQDGAISTSERDTKRLAFDIAKRSVEEAQATLDRLISTNPEQLNKAKGTLAQISEVRPEDVRSAQADVNRAIAARNQAKANLEQLFVRSPVDGEVLFVHTRTGELISTDGIVEIGQVQQMQVIAEIYESDVSKVRLGQKVKVSSDAIDGEITGTVDRIGSQVRRQAIVNTDPSANIDTRVVEVQVKLDAVSSQKAAKLTNLQVMVVISQ